MYFKLEGKVVVPITMQEHLEIAMSTQSLSTTLKVTTFDGIAAKVSTVFLGVCPVTAGETPQVFETMVFGGPKISSTRHRYDDFDMALAGHRKMCGELARAIVANPGPWPEQNNLRKDDPDEDSPAP